MAPFFRSSKVWVVDFTYLGRPRRWLKAFPSEADAQAEMGTLLQDLYGDRALLTSVRLASPQEDMDYVRGNLPKNMLCPTGRAPRSRPGEEAG